MALISMVEDLKRAREGGYAVPLFDLFEMLAAEGTFLALEDRRAPAIAAVYSYFIDRENIEAFSASLKVLAEAASVPVSVMLDHGQNPEQCLKALALGFTDVMYDGSALTFEENVKNTRAVAREAHAQGVGVEGELGLVGSGADYHGQGARGEGFTDPDLVVEFVERTGVDSLAIAFGTAHGHYRGEPRLDFALLDEIRGRVNIPLVMHGGSGLAKSQFREAISRGISKINVSTALVTAAAERVKEAAVKEDASYFKLTGAIRDSYRREVAEYLDLFGVSGKG
jgi:fructose-bisphosphate aldolase class II